MCRILDFFFSDIFEFKNVYGTEGSEPLAVGSVAAASALAILPFLGPLLEIYLFSRKSPEDIENSVRIKEPLQVSANKYCTSCQSISVWVESDKKPTVIFLTCDLVSDVKDWTTWKAHCSRPYSRRFRTSHRIKSTSDTCSFSKCRQWA